MRCPPSTAQWPAVRSTAGARETIVGAARAPPSTQLRGPTCRRHGLPLMPVPSGRLCGGRRGRGSERDVRRQGLGLRGMAAATQTFTSQRQTLDVDRGDANEGGVCLDMVRRSRTVKKHRSTKTTKRMTQQTRTSRPPHLMSGESSNAPAEA